MEIWPLILSSNFLLQWHTQKGIMLASFRFESYSVTSFSSPDLCTPPQQISAEFKQKNSFLKNVLTVFELH